MLQVMKFILNCVVSLARMLFTINIGDGFNLGLLMCIIFIFLPIVHRIICFVRQDAVDELNSRYDEGRPRESHYAEKHTTVDRGNGTYLSYSHSFSKSRRLRR